MANEDQLTQWGMKGEKTIKPKSIGAVIMVSDFIDEHNGFLALTEDEYNVAIFDFMPRNFLKLVKVGRDTGHATGLLSR